MTDPIRAALDQLLSAGELAQDCINPLDWWWKMDAAIKAARAALAEPLPPKVGHIQRLADIIEECQPKTPYVIAATALAQAILSHPDIGLVLANSEGPAVPESRELSDEDLDALERKHWRLDSVIEDEPGEGFRESYPREETFDHRAYARAVLARWGCQPTPPAEGEEPMGKEPPIQPTGRSGLTWKAAIDGLRDVLADQTEDAIRSVWQRFRILDAIDLMAANHPAAPAAPELGETAATAAIQRLNHIADFMEPGSQDRWAIENAAALLQQQEAEINRLRAQQTPVPVSERLPEPNTKVIAHYFNDLGNGRTICAIWVPAKSWSDDINDDYDNSDHLEYDETDDCYYWPEGWYETIENWDELGYVKVNEGDVIYWQPLPTWPAHALPQPQGEVK